MITAIIIIIIIVLSIMIKNIFTNSLYAKKLLKTSGKEKNMLTLICS